jgi:hypothetical protein
MLKEKRFTSSLVIALLLSTFVYISLPGLLVTKSVDMIIPKAAGQTPVSTNVWFSRGPAPQIDNNEHIPFSGRVNVIAFSPDYNGKGTPAVTKLNDRMI